MVASLDIHILIRAPGGDPGVCARFESRSEVGGGRVIASLIRGNLVPDIDSALREVNGAPLGVVALTESEALEAIVAGADDAAVIDVDDEAAITAFLDRVRNRANLRRERQRQEWDFAHAEKLTALGSVLAGVAHEVNNPLAAIMLAFDVLRGNYLAHLRAAGDLHDLLLSGDDISSDRLQETLAKLRADSESVVELLDDVTGATEVVAQLVRDLRVFSRSDVAEQPVPFEPQAVLEQALRLVRRELGPRTIVEFDLGKDLPELCLPRNRLTQVLTNLLLNAVHATREVERDVHRIRLGARADEHYVALSISDTGHGIPEDSLEKVFDPFFTTKREGEGTGLGLSISRSIVQHMGGDLQVSSVDGNGATFVCFLPLPEAEVVAAVERRRHQLPAYAANLPKAPAVLLMDDDARLLRVTTRVLQEQFRVLIARDGREGYELLESGSHVDAVVLELALPELDGVEFFRWVQDNKPHLADRIVFVTAAQERPEYLEFLKDVSAPVLLKPASREELLEAVFSVIPKEALERSIST